MAILKHGYDFQRVFGDLSEKYRMAERKFKSQRKSNENLNNSERFKAFWCLKYSNFDAWLGFLMIFQGSKWKISTSSKEI